jgi:hypothetical protein
MDLTLVKRPPTDEKAFIGFKLYASINNELQAICVKEDIRISDLLRHLVNNFLIDYHKEEKVSPATEVAKVPTNL